MSSRKVHQIVSGRWRENGYILEDHDANALIIDPGLNADGFLAVIRGRGCRPRAIVNTHAHFDHIGSVAMLMDEFSIPFFLHKGDATLLRQANLYRKLFEETEPVRIPSTFSDLSELRGSLHVDGFDGEVLMTPGHTKGSACFVFDDLLFTGDTLLGTGPGRVDLPGGSVADMATTQTNLASLPGDLIVHPGHGRIVELSDIRRRMATT